MSGARTRTATIGLLLFALAFTVFRASPRGQLYDSKYALVVAHQLAHHATLDLGDLARRAESGASQRRGLLSTSEGKQLRSTGAERPIPRQSSRGGPRALRSSCCPSFHPKRHRHRRWPPPRGR